MPKQLKRDELHLVRLVVTWRARAMRANRKLNNFAPADGATVGQKEGGVCEMREARKVVKLCFVVVAV